MQIMAITISLRLNGAKNRNCILLVLWQKVSKDYEMKPGSKIDRNKVWPLKNKSTELKNFKSDM